jgi:hypothetical protein
MREHVLMREHILMSDFLHTGDSDLFDRALWSRGCVGCGVRRTGERLRLSNKRGRRRWVGEWYVDGRVDGRVDQEEEEEDMAEEGEAGADSV